MLAAIQPDLRFRPEIPHTPEEFDLPERVVLDLFLRRVYVDGTTSIRNVAEQLCLSPAIVNRVFRYYRDQRVLDVHGSREDENYRFSLTSAGQRLAASRMRVSEYVGPAPVSLAAYSESVRAQAAQVEVDPSLLEQALGDLIVHEDVIRKLGPALISQKSLFLYGPTGNGKTAIAERLHRIYSDTVLIPYALEVDGQIIMIHDPILHRKVDPQPDDIDPRWVLCKRPFVVVGGELTGDMLELRLDTSSGTYAAPVQMKANTGMLVIDDFGRQVIPARKLLNRWIVPMDRRMDFLTLRYGLKFEIPFEVMIVLATNFDPHDLADEAFLRRLPNKIHLGTISAQTFDDIFERYVRVHNLDVEPDAAGYVRELCEDAGCPALRACLPGDLCSIARCVKRFDRSGGRLTRKEFEAAVDLYFADTEKTPDTDLCVRGHAAGRHQMQAERQ